MAKVIGAMVIPVNELGRVILTQEKESVVEDGTVKAVSDYMVINSETACAFYLGLKDWVEKQGA